MLNPYQKDHLKIKQYSEFEKPPLTNIVKIYNDYAGGHPFIDRGRYISVQCAFHDDSKPSMALYPETGTYYCFACGEGGDGYKFIMETSGIDFKEALEIVKENYLL